MKKTPKKIKNYNFEERWGSYSKTRINVFASEVGNGVTKQQIHHSFLLHAIGIKMLYAGDINDTYYRLKNEFLSKNVDKVKNQLPKIIKDIIANIFLSLCEFLDNADSTVQVVIKKYTDEIIKESETFITQVVSDRRILFAPDKAVSQENINNLIKILRERFFSFKDKYKYEKPKINNLAQKYSSKLSKLAIKCAIDELKRLGWLDVDGKCFNKDERQKRSRNLGLVNGIVTNTSFPELVTKCYRHLSDTRGHSHADRALQTSPAISESDLAELYLTDLKNLSKNIHEKAYLDYMVNRWREIYSPESNLDLMLLFDDARLIEAAIRVNVCTIPRNQDKKLARNYVKLKS